MPCGSRVVVHEHATVYSIENSTRCWIEAAQLDTLELRSKFKHCLFDSSVCTAVVTRCIATGSRGGLVTSDIK